MYILGISAFYHDSAAALIKDGKIIAAAQEERFTRKKHDPDFPVNAIKYCLKQENINLDQVDMIAFYDKPFLKFDRILETYFSDAPRGIKSFLYSMPVWLKEKLLLKQNIIKSLESIQFENKKVRRKIKKKFKEIVQTKIHFCEHHQSHAASAFYPSPFEKSAIITIDGVGEWTTTSIALGDKNKIKVLKEIHFPHSLGLLYSAFTYYTGFKVNSGEYKVMGLAPYGKPIYVDLIKEHLIDIKDDGSFNLDMSYFGYTSTLEMTSSKFNKLFGAPPRKREGEVTQREMDLAASIQVVTEEIVLKLAAHAREITGVQNLCLSGGVALNCVANGKLLEKKIFNDIWMQPASGDAGSALGAALYVYHHELEKNRVVDSRDSMRGSYLGPHYSNSEVKEHLDKMKASYHFIQDEEALVDTVSKEIANGKVVGWHQGRMEFGPRALGARSIIGDAQNQEMQSIMNLKIKYRESFRPFAPAVLRTEVNNWFEINCDSPYMLLVSPVKEDKKFQVAQNSEELFGIEKLKVPRSKIPAVTHVDYSARVQTVHEDTNPRFYKLIQSFQLKTGCPVIINTSFNVRGEPIVCSPSDSFRCFMRTEMDVLVVENYILYKKDQSQLINDSNWKEEFELD